MVAYLTRDAGGGPPPTSNEAKLQAEVRELQAEIRAALDRIEAHAVEGVRLENETRRLRTQLDAAREVVVVASRHLIGIDEHGH